MRDFEKIDAIAAGCKGDAMALETLLDRPLLQQLACPSAARWIHTPANMRIRDRLCNEFCMWPIAAISLGH